MDEKEIKRRLEDGRGPTPAPRRGYGWLYSRHILQADKGCDFDFLVREGREPERATAGSPT